MRSDPADLHEILWLSRLLSYGWASATTLLWYDTLLTLPAEVTYIWRFAERSSTWIMNDGLTAEFSSGWSLPKLLYLFVRYWSLFIATLSAAVFSRVQHSILRCQLFVWFSVTIGGSLVMLFVIDVILFLRLHALYGQNVKVFWVLVALNTVNVVMQVYVLVNVGIKATKATFLAPPGAPLLGCLSNPDLSSTLFAWVSGIALAVFYFVMMMAKFYQSVVDARRVRVRVRLPPLMKAFVRDGTVYFLLFVVVILSGALDSFLATGPLVSFYLPWSLFAYVVAATRLILNLRAAAYVDGPTLGDTFFRALETRLAFDRSYANPS
ncbi:hypothetical protein GALMADRAFT_150532 [Galerina marginata CBS 339.88]|uniref:DUF6533 domain-containing protein n=1 Tax=Galerina marginata (strain CBS 339.88) TaxID=685588 RepID=A0A067TJU9_GALM3|nr:hypothetical protein GALMADRAFT_150532 [Galerina marginata CBS 339.88]